MAVQDKSEGTGSINIAMGGDQMCLDVSPPAVQLKEMCLSGDEHAPKVRKTYTITKLRERWTEEEHKKFLEALKLYGRAWRHIEEHVGSKTAVQIRSHAQKFFSKVVRESSSSSPSSAKPIEIPPPRPKKKPMHPYPRKVIHSIKKQTSGPEQPERSPSPTSVLSTVGSDISGSKVSNPHNGSPLLVSSADGVKHVSLLHAEQESRYTSSTSLAEEENGSSETIRATSSSTQQEQSSMKSDLGSKYNASREEGSAVEAPTISLKLFGRTVLVTDSHRPSSSPIGIGKSLASESRRKNFDTNERKPMETSPQNPMQNYFVLGSSQTACSPWSGGGPSAFQYMQFHKEGLNPVGVSAAPPTCWTSLEGLPFPFLPSPSQNPVQMPPDSRLEAAVEDREIQNKEGSLTGSNTSPLSEVGMADKNGGVIDSQSQEPSGEQLDPVFLFKPSAMSAFSRLRASPEKYMKEFLPYKTCLAETDASEIIDEEIEGKRIWLCL